MVAILHEGKDDKKYIKRILEHLNLEFSDENFHEMNNKSNFFKEEYFVYKLLKQKIENEEIEKILFILDVDNPRDNDVYGGKENTLKELQDTINKLDFTFKYEIFVVCEPNSNEGYFETLLLSSVDEEIKNCYTNFMKCTGFEGKEQTKTIMTKLHEFSSPKKPYSFEHNNFKEIKDFFTNNYK